MTAGMRSWMLFWPFCLHELLVETILNRECGSITDSTKNNIRCSLPLKDRIFGAMLGSNHTLHLHMTLLFYHNSYEE